MAKPIFVKRNKQTAAKYRYEYALVQPRKPYVWIIAVIAVFILFILPLFWWFGMQDSKNIAKIDKSYQIADPAYLADNDTELTENKRLKPELKQPLSIVMSPLLATDKTDSLEATLQNQGQLAIPAQNITASLPKLNQLLIKAGQQLRDLRLTRPKNDNAYHSYQQLKACNQSIADALLNAIAQRYVGLIEKNIDQEHLEKSKQLLLSLNKLHPTYDQSYLKQILLKKVLFLLKKQPPMPYGMPYFEFLQDLKIDPIQIAKARLLILSNLEQRVIQQIEKKWYSTPQGNNAKYSYQLMLKLDANNHFAKKGLTALSNKYADLVEKAIEQKADSQAQQLLRRGLAIADKNKRLLSLQKELQKKPKTKQKTKQNINDYEAQIIAAIDDGEIDKSLAILNAALKKHPKHQGLLDLKQTIENGLSQQ